MRGRRGPTVIILRIGKGRRWDRRDDRALKTLIKL